jgi:hypothetical protein
MGVGGDDVHLGANFLKLGVVVSGVFHFSGAVKGESGRHKNEHIPLALEGFVGDGDKLAVVKGLVFEGLNLCIDERHVISVRVKKIKAVNCCDAQIIGRNYWILFLLFLNYRLKKSMVSSLRRHG